MALVGDSIDNIPGVPGVGPKTAAKWLQQFGDLETLKARAGEVGGKIGERLRESLGALDLSKELATIRCDVELPLTLDELALRPQDAARLGALFERLEFTRLLRRVREGARRTRRRRQPPPRRGAERRDAGRRGARAARPAATRPSSRWKRSSAGCERIAAAPLVALDTETTSLAYMRAELVGISLAVTPGEAAYIPLAHRYPGAPDQLNREAVLARLKPWLESAAPKVGHHLKYDAHIFANHGIALRGIEHDTMLESYVLNSTATRHDMDSVAALYLGLDDAEVRGSRRQGREANHVRPGRSRHGDALLGRGRRRRAAAARDAVAEARGRAGPRSASTRTSSDRSCACSSKWSTPASWSTRACCASRAKSSPRRWRRPRRPRTPPPAARSTWARRSSCKRSSTSGSSCPCSARRRRASRRRPRTCSSSSPRSYELPRLILEYRALTKLKSTYTDKLPIDIDPRTKRIHTSYHQAVAATGRLSSSDPNLQNIPIRTAEGRRIRQAFIAPPGFKLLAADYSQIELRIMAHLSGDEGLLAAFASDQDVHRATAAEVFGAALDAVTSDQRRSAKAINFGLIYGMSAFGLAKQLGIERGQAQAYVDRYFERYPGVRRYMDETRASARRSGFVSTVFGRRLYLPEINARNNQLRQYAERSAINAPMQGTAADIIKRAMIGVAAWLAAEEPRARLIMQVHDELVVEVPEERAVDDRRRRRSNHGSSGGAARAAARRSRYRRQLGRSPLGQAGTFVKSRRD